MSSRFRRSLVLTTFVALFAVSPVGFAAGPPTTVNGIDVDATTIPQLQQFMNSGQINSITLTNFYLARIGQLNPTLHAVTVGEVVAPERFVLTARRWAAHAAPIVRASARGPTPGRHRPARLPCAP